MIKRGEITSTQVPILIMALIGFAILLYFIYTVFDNQNPQDTELCRVSVLTRATAPDIAQAAVPLKCTTNKICITLSGRETECPQFIGEKPHVIKLLGSPDNVADAAAMRTTIEQTLANSMYDCWKMMGQGKLDLYGSVWKSFGLNEETLGKATCVICTRVALGNDLVTTGIQRELKLADYLKQQRVPPDYKVSYLEAFTDLQFNTYPSVQQINSYFNENKIVEDTSITVQGVDNHNQLAIVFAQNKPKQWEEVATNFGYALFGTYMRAPKGVNTVLALTEAGIAAVGISNAIEGQYAAALQCGTLVASEASVQQAGGSERFRHGCSLVQTLPYDVKSINALCQGGIQSIP